MATDFNNTVDRVNVNNGDACPIIGMDGDRYYPGIDLTVKFADEIRTEASGNPWAWIKSRITASYFDGIHVMDYIPYTDTTTSKRTRNARVMGINTYKNYGDTAVGNHIDFWGGLWTPNKPINKVNFNNGTTESEHPWLASDAYLYANSLAGKVPSEAKVNPTLEDVDYTSDGIYHFLPANLKNVIKQKRLYLPKRYSADGLLTDDNAAAWADIGNVWFPTEFEIYGSAIWSTKDYGAYGSPVQYPLFAHGYRRQIFGRTYWWSLSARSGNSTNWCYTSYNGSANAGSASASSVAAPVCFRVA